MSEQVVDGEFSEVPGTAIAIPDPTYPPRVRKEVVPRDVVPRDHDGQLWDRAMGEGVLGFSWFEVYRSLGPGRSAVRAYNEIRRLKGMPPARSLSGRWVKVSVAWAWKRRAEAWDQHLIDQDRVVEVEARKKDREQRLIAAKALRGKAGLALQALQPSDFSAGDVINALKTANAETRLEYEGDARQRAQQSDDGEVAPIKVLVGITLEDI